MQIRKITEITPDVESLAAQASAQRFESICRLVFEHASGANRFDKKGECLLGAFEAGELIGIGGVNIEPYNPAPGVGRVRRFFVAQPWRRHGVGSALLRHIEVNSQPWFSVLQLFTPSAQAGAFYERMGYERLENRVKVSHAKQLVVNAALQRQD